ncbi:uncharacterized protein J3R85_000630 [Psidium guajava]|nr:uncharacterized protein J3R85_000630 [Psidium guajava]
MQKARESRLSSASLVSTTTHKLPLSRSHHPHIAAAFFFFFFFFFFFSILLTSHDHQRIRFTNLITQVRVHTHIRRCPGKELHSRRTCHGGHPRAGPSPRFTTTLSSASRRRLTPLTLSPIGFIGVLWQHPDPIGRGLGIGAVVEAAGPDCIVPGQIPPVKLLGVKVWPINVNLKFMEPVERELKLLGKFMDSAVNLMNKSFIDR